MPVTTRSESGHFFERLDGVLHATPLLAVMLVIAPADVMFSVDSIPAIFSVTTDPFIVYTSNVFALMGLCSIFFAFAGLMRMFHYLRHGLAAVLVFVGVKMLIQDWMKIPIVWSLVAIVAILSVSVIASALLPRKDGQGFGPLKERPA
jgi:tellurite resistance protein TerC